jgi:hypothetical protein
VGTGSLWRSVKAAQVQKMTDIPRMFIDFTAGNHLFSGNAPDCLDSTADTSHDAVVLRLQRRGECCCDAYRMAEMHHI